MQVSPNRHRDEPEPQTWTTLGAVPGRQFAYWREVICEAFLDLSPESDLRDGFIGIVRQRQFGRLDVAQIDSQRQRVLRTEADIGRTPRDGYYANLQLRGTSATVQGGRRAILRPGDIALVDTIRPFELGFPGDFRQLSFFVPRAVLDAQAPDGVRTATRLDTITGVGAAIRHALVTLRRGTLRPETAERLAYHVIGMLAVTQDLAAAGASASRSPRSYRAAVADIEEHLADDDLAPATTALRLGMSVRSLHALFTGHDRSYAATVRRLRLERAWRDLRDPARDHLRVIDIAADAGFSDVSTFHRAFRREFGRSPAQVRSEGHGDRDHLGPA